ncbi:hypothetical protein EB118_17670 [bacterium]|nr:hypothetical protein [bacterium]
MCIAILNKEGKLPQSALDNSWKNNNEGGGLMWVQDGMLKVFKTYDFNEFSDMYYAIRTNENIGNVVLHFRIATSGFDKLGTNLHPFLVNDDLGFVHNGIISGLGNKEHSDTYQFNELLKGLPNDFLHNDSIMHFIGEYISSSKLIFLDSNDKYAIVNESYGHWDLLKQNWYSNDSYKSYNDWYYYGNTKISKSGSNVSQPVSPLSKNAKKRKAKKNRAYIQKNFINATEFRLEYLEDLFKAELHDEEFMEQLEMYYHETWEGDLEQLIKYIEEDKLSEKVSQHNDYFSEHTYYGYGKYKSLDFYDNKDYDSVPF